MSNHARGYTSHGGTCRAYGVCLIAAMLAGMTLPQLAAADVPRALPDGQKPDDARLGELRTLNDYFPMQTVDTPEQWEQRAEQLRRRILLANGLWPMLPRTPLEPVIHGKVERDEYTVERVFFESVPGHYVTGSLYRPKGDVPEGGRPAVLSAHGHWPGGRFHDHGEHQVRHEIAQGAERFEHSGRFPLQARAVQLARMGAVVFFYDMIGYADNNQLTEHRPGVRDHMNTPEQFGFFSPQAELRQINTKGLQTWNSIRALDFLESLDDVDPARIGMTGGSGGATQTFVLCAIDHRIAVSVPAVMVSTAMQGGCTCENAPHFRVNAGNVDYAALIAPRPLGLIHADDWTVEMPEKGMPELREHFAMLDAADNLDDAPLLHFGHNYNAVSRTFMYNFMNRHLGLGHDEPVLERDFEPLPREEATVWTDDHPAPSGEQAGEAHERELVAWWDQAQREQIEALTPADADGLAEFRRVIGGAIETIVGRTLDDVGETDFDLVHKTEADDYVLMTGPVTHHHEQQEQLPALFIHPRPDDRWNGEVVVMLHERGKAGLLEADGSLTPDVAQLIEAGFSVASADLFGQGEFTDDGEPAAQRTGQYADGSQPWMRYAGYKHGYNPSLFASRVHDVLTMIAFSYATPYDTQRVHLIASGKTVGPIAAAAGAVADDRLHSLAVDTAGFRFADVDSFEHPMFAPAMARHGDVPALFALNAPRSLRIAGEGDTPPQVVAATYNAADAEAEVRHQDDEPAPVQWLIGR